MSADLFGLDPVPGGDAPDKREQLQQDAAQFATELRACESLAAYSEVVRRLLKHPLPGLLFSLVPCADPGGQLERLGALVATTRHRLDPPPVSKPEPPGTRFPRRTR